jgi:rRNA processing protein Gar1
MSPGAQKVKTGRDALGTAENEYGSAKHENESGRAKRVSDALYTAENEFGRSKHENGTRRPRYRRKRD